MSNAAPLMRCSGLDRTNAVLRRGIGGIWCCRRFMRCKSEWVGLAPVR